MKRQIRKALSFISLALLLAATGAGPVSAKEKWPATSTDGLDLVPGTKLEAVYKKAGASLAQYKRVAILDCAVAFRKNWQRDQNEDRSFGDQVSAKDMDRIRKTLSEEFTKVFTEELTKGGHQVVTEGAEDVLVLRPAIIDLDVAAPDVMSAGMSQTFSASGGQMTLYVELYDSVTSSLLARAIDTREASNAGGIMIANRVTNKADADRILRRWAGILVKALDEAKK